MVSRIEDVQQAVGPLMFLAMGGYFATFAGLNAPDAEWVKMFPDQDARPARHTRQDELDRGQLIKCTFVAVL